jgi:small-conductance mechanosensitive channel
LDGLFELERLQNALADLQAWVIEHVFVAGSIGQVVAVGVAFWVSSRVAVRIGGWVERKSGARWLKRGQLEQFRAALPVLARPAVWLVLMWLVVLISSAANWPLQVSKAVMSLLTAWIVIRLAAALIKEPGWSKLVTLTAWSVAALNILNLLGPTVELLDALALNLGDLRISVLSVGKGLLVLGFLLWLANVGSHLLEKRIQSLPNLTPSVQVLFTKLLKITFFTLAIVAALHSVGIDLTAFAVFGGAVGLGVGFGLQKVVSNLISGVILLMDKSVKPGDVIAIGDQFGWINSLGARYVSLITRDGIEHLIPNEDLISQRVENWSHSHQLVRLKVPFGIAYDSNVREALGFAEAAASGVDRVLSEPAPTGRMVGFGDSAIDLELRVWIRDPRDGVANVKSEIMLNILDALRENAVEIPFPRRDVVFKAEGAVPVQMVNDPPGTGTTPSKT